MILQSPFQLINDALVVHVVMVYLVKVEAAKSAVMIVVTEDEQTWAAASAVTDAVVNRDSGIGY